METVYEGYDENVTINSTLYCIEICYLETYSEYNNCQPKFVFIWLKPFWANFGTITIIAGLKERFIKVYGNFDIFKPHKRVFKLWI